MAATVGDLRHRRWRRNGDEADAPCVGPDGVLARRPSPWLRRGGDSDGRDRAPTASTVITWWHNGNNDPLKSYWARRGGGVHGGATPASRSRSTPLQNEDLRTRITVGLQSNDPPDLFQQWGGGEMASQVESGKVMDLTDEIPDVIESVGGSAAGWQMDGKTVRPAVRPRRGRVLVQQGDLFARPASASLPTTIDEFFGAVDKLKGAGIAPIAVGARTSGPTRSTGTTSPCASAARTSSSRPARTSTSPTRASSRPARTGEVDRRRAAVPRRASSVRRPSRARPAPPACSPTARPRWS